MKATEKFNPLVRDGGTLGRMEAGWMETFASVALVPGSQTLTGFAGIIRKLLLSL